MVLASGDIMTHAPVFCELMSYHGKELHAFAGIGVLYVAIFEHIDIIDTYQQRIMHTSRQHKVS